MLKVKKNDRVKVVKGKDKGKSGKVLRINRQDEKVYVEGANIISKHTRQQDQSKPGGIIKKEGPINIANVRVVCPNCSKPARIGFDISESGIKNRICKKCNQQI
ncbi:MAG TPA: 50S ribosomal protein L24 [Actinobacteria bacterium]|nr:50S ribosomal protein L24 [Actinomycetota bacterium]